MSRTVAASHNDWLTLVEPAGGFLTLPVLKRVLPNGVPVVDRDTRQEVRVRLEALSDGLAERTDWLHYVLRELLGLDNRLRESAGVPAAMTHVVAEQGTTLRPDFAVVEPTPDEGQTVRLLVCRWPLRTALDRRPLRDEHGHSTRWAATPIERAAALCRAANVPMALVTDTDRFALVWAPRNGATGHATWVSSLFAEERGLLDSFVALLGARRFFGVSQDETLEALLKESGEAQHEVTSQLGHQVREAVELLVSAFSRAHRASGERLLKGHGPVEVYNAAVTVMMRLVVLLSAEERRLFPIDDDVYAEAYSVLALRELLQEQASAEGIEALEKRHAAWYRLLALFRVVYGGVAHDRLHLPAYGGGLFDPDKYPFLERPTPLPVDDRTVLAILNSLQVLRFRQGGITEARRLSYRNLSVGQIGHVYEGLLDHGCRAAKSVVVGVLGKKGDEPELELDALESELKNGEAPFGAWLAEQGGPAPSRVVQLLYEELEPDADHRLRAACDNDEATYRRVRPFAGILRRDLRDLPMVFLPGAVYVTQTSLRRDSGTAYTTEELADEVVRFALEPAVYSPGPAELADPAGWKLKTSAGILQLKVCDPAVGSGAILVAACRFLAARLVEAWREEPANTGQPGARPAHLAEDDWLLHAQSVIVDHCLYGVDRNPMAVEMAKLSLWLTTLAKERPFTFLDHQIRCGDSLLGVTSLDQIRCFHIDPSQGRSLHGESLFDPTKAIDPLVESGLARARALGAFDVVTLRDVSKKAALQREMADALEPLAVVADAVVGAALSTARSSERPVFENGQRVEVERETIDERLQSVADAVHSALAEDIDDATRVGALATLRDTAAYWLDTDRPEGGIERQPLHWPLVFPEVFLAPGRMGFDAIVGNPPFLGGQRITGAIGTAYRNYLVERIASGKRGSADLVAYFFLRALTLVGEFGGFGLLATNTIAQGDTREVGLDQLLERGATIIRAVQSEKWPGTANLAVAKVWAWRGEWKGLHVLSGGGVASITSFLAARGRVEGTPVRLRSNEKKSFQGSIVLGMGFVMTPEQAAALIAKDGKNRDVLSPYLNGEDLNSRCDQSPSRWVINFRAWPLDRTAEGTWEGASDDEIKNWLRSGRVPADYPESVAADYPDCFEIVERLVKPERAKNNRAVYRDRWWHYGEKRPELYATISGLQRILALSIVTHHVGFAFVPAGIVFAHRLALFPLDRSGHLALMQSSLHESWAREYSSQLETRLNYSPTDCLETFPFPPSFDSLDEIGRHYEEHRCSIMLTRREGLTKTYNRLHDPTPKPADIVRLRELQIEMDRAVAAAYSWSDLALDHGFHETKQGIRFTVSPAARQEILDRLLELNHQRHAEEVAAGFQGDSSGSGGKASIKVGKGSRSNKSKAAPHSSGGGLFQD